MRFVLHVYTKIFFSARKLFWTAPFLLNDRNQYTNVLYKNAVPSMKSKIAQIINIFKFPSILVRRRQY